MPSLTSTARWTGAAYLGLALTGMVGHLVLTSQITAPGDPAEAVTRLRENPALAELAIVFELLIVITQALAAWGFFALFRRDDPTAAFGVAAFGLANASAILISAALLATSLAVASDATLAPGGDGAGTVALLHGVSTAVWNGGKVFFGLWLVPMGAFALTTRRMPRPLGWALVIGGAAYVVGALLGAVASIAPIAEALGYLATVGELWMIGYLLSVGIRPRSVTPA
ncbi:MAG: DUF4386 domain-containing protein [Protaetiibacter sp.]